MPLVSVFANRTSRLQTVHFHDGPHKYKCVHAYVFSTVFTCPTGIIVLAKKKKLFACITTCTDVLKWKHIPVHVCLWCLWHKEIFGLYFCLFVFDCHHVCSCKEQEVCMYDLVIIHELWKMPIYQQHKREKKKKWRKASFILMLYLEYWSGNMRNHL